MVGNFSMARPTEPFTPADFMLPKFARKQQQLRAQQQQTAKTIDDQNATFLNALMQSGAAKVNVR